MIQWLYTKNHFARIQWSNLFPHNTVNSFEKYFVHHFIMSKADSGCNHFLLLLPLGLQGRLWESGFIKLLLIFLSTIVACECKISFVKKFGPGTEFKDVDYAFLKCISEHKLLLLKFEISLSLLFNTENIYAILYFHNKHKSIN